MIKAVLNNVANATRSPQEKREIEERKQQCATLKLASIVAAVVSLLFFAAFPSLFTFTASALALFVAREVYYFAENGLELCTDITVEARARMNQEQQHKQLFKNTYLLGTIVQILQP